MRHVRNILFAVFSFFAVQLSAQLQFGELGTSNTPGPPSSALNTPINQVISIVNEVEEKQNFIENLTGDSSLVLPAGIIKKIGATRYVIAVDSIRFEEKGAYLNAFAALDMPGTTKKLAFRGSGIKFNPKGVIPGESSRLYLASDHFIRIDSCVVLKIPANYQNWVEWDCGGFKAVNLTGNFIFSGSKLKPDPSSQDTAVTATFQIYTEDIHNFIATVNISPFTIQGLKDWSFKVVNAVVDMSEIANSPAMLFPANYSNPNVLSPQMWTGFFLQSAIVKLPPELSPAGKRLEVQANNLMIDKTGVSGILTVNNLFDANRGSMSGWGFSIDQLSVSFLQNKLNSGSMKGKLVVPVFEENESLNYNASLNYNNLTREVNYQFLVSASSELTFKAFSAQLTLNQNSSVTVIKTGSTFAPSANLNGFVSFAHNSFNSNGGKLAFQDLVINTHAPYIHSAVFSLNNINNSQSKSAKFPVSVNSISLGVVNGNPLLGMSVSLNLSDQSSNSLGVVTGIMIHGKYEPGEISFQSGNKTISYDKPKYTFDKVVITDVGIDIQTSPFTLNGKLIFRDNDPVYGDGFFGNLNFSLASVMENAAGVTVAFGAKETYRYFYIDAKVPVSFMLGNLPIRITGLTGGMYRHMRPSKTSMSEFIALNQSPPTGNALSYVPDATSALGFKAGVAYEFAANEIPFNGDLMLEVNFNSSGGLSNVGLNGDVFSMSRKATRATAPVKGNICVNYDVPAKTFDAAAQVTVNVQNQITGNGSIKIHIDPQIWFVSVGRPTAPNTINYVGLISSSYFMAGNTLEPPVVPQELLNKPDISSVLGNRDQSKLNNGGGFCAGARIQSSLNKTFGYSFFTVSADVNFKMGFDMMLTNYGENAVCQGTSEKVGVKGWQAAGAMYLLFNSNVSARGTHVAFDTCPTEVCVLGICETVNLPCIRQESFDKHIFSINACGIIQAKAPKPVYLQGNFICNYNIMHGVNGSFNLDFNYGSNCNPTGS